MIKAPWIMKRIGASTNAEADVAAVLAQTIAVFEEKTGSLWTARENHELRIEVDPERPSGSLWIPATNVSNLLLRESPTSYTDAASTDPIDDAEYEISQIGSSAEILPIGRSWAKFVVATFSCGYPDLPTSLASVREAIVQQVQYDLARNRGENIAVSSRFGRDTVGATFREVDGVPSFRAAIVSHRVIEV
jgi:hypothetical protein